VLRDRMGEYEDRFFATVFFGSGIVFICMFFAAAAVVGAVLVAFVAEPAQLVNSATYHFARALAYAILNVYMIKAAAVFMVTTSTVVIYTGIAPRWLALLGYALALVLLFASYSIRWSFLLFPLWELDPHSKRPAQQSQRRLTNPRPFTRLRRGRPGPGCRRHARAPVPPDSRTPSSRHGRAAPIGTAIPGAGCPAGSA
jgi:hypothetical protein